MKPSERSEPFNEFLDYLQEQSRSDVGTVIKYSQARKAGRRLRTWSLSTDVSCVENDNLRDEYAFLYEGDVERDVRWASLALGRKPDVSGNSLFSNMLILQGPSSVSPSLRATPGSLSLPSQPHCSIFSYRAKSISNANPLKAINLWIGNSLSTTALHRDNYENIYFQITGSKDFVLLPPLATACINEQFLPSATFDSTMKIIPDEPPSHVPCAIWDPDRPDENITEFSHLAQPIRVRLKPGDALFLPALWYHKVSQRNDEDGICCSVNYCRLMDHLVAAMMVLTGIQGTIWTLKADSIPLMHLFGKLLGLPREQKSHDYLRGMLQIPSIPAHEQALFHIMISDSSIYNALPQCPDLLAMHQQHLQLKVRPLIYSL